MLIHIPHKFSSDVEAFGFSDAMKHYMKGTSDPTVKNYLFLVAIGNYTETLKMSGPND